MIELLKPYISEILLAVGGISAWIFERNKRNQEIKQAETQNIQAIVDLYQDAIKDLRVNYDGNLKELKIKVEGMETDIEQLRKNVNLWKSKYRDLKAEFDMYKAKHP